MNTKNSQQAKLSAIFVIPTLSNDLGLSGLLKLTQKYCPQIPTIIVNNNTLSLENKIDQPLTKNITILNNKKNNWAAISPLLLTVENKIENNGYQLLPFGKVKLIKERNFSGKIDGISGAALIINADIFNKLHGFDERFFAYLEDVDLCLRLKNKGYKFGVAIDESVQHVGQATSSHIKTRRAYYNFRNWIYLILKNWGVKKMLMNLPCIIVERGRNLAGIVKSLR